MIFQKRTLQKIFSGLPVPTKRFFCIGGIYSRWINPADNSEWFTYSMVMTDANSIMQIVHNSAWRMPVVLNREEEKEWLNGRNKDDFANRDHIELIAKLVSKLGDL
ncbi:SOS response-associated peptidase family protein [Dyadobacter sp. NIV53]|uniref:SOS response-associated peptidase family protein n=1 Tax=Dyadobacter sp. NIV53 TaxID=2861765 RepID=UPI00286E5C72|nr:SOS response-associated peptidase family protein [Dyadobacter sp. NIV53]